MPIYEILLRESTVARGVRESACPIEDWQKMAAYYSDTDELRKMGLRMVEAYLRDENDDEVLLIRWEVEDHG